MQRVTLSGQNYRSRNGAWSGFPFKCVISRSSCPIMHECNNEQGRNRGIEEAETGDLTGGRLNKRCACTCVVCVCVRALAYVCGSKPPWAMLFRISRFKERKKNPYALNNLLVGTIDHYRYIDIDGHTSIFECVSIKILKFFISTKLEIETLYGISKLSRSIFFFFS